MAVLALYWCPFILGLFWRFWLLLAQGGQVSLSTCAGRSLWTGIPFCAVSRLVLEHQVWVWDQNRTVVSCLRSFGLTCFPLPWGSCSSISWLTWCCNGFPCNRNSPMVPALYIFQKEGDLAQGKLWCNLKQIYFMITIFLSLFSPVQILLLQGKVGCKDLYCLFNY